MKYILPVRNGVCVGRWTCVKGYKCEKSIAKKGKKEIECEDYKIKEK